MLQSLSPAQKLQLCQAVEYALEIPEISVRVKQLYEEIQQQVKLKNPRCDRSGRCCRFEEYGHRLFVTTVELAAFFGHAKSGLFSTPRTINEGCPYQVDRLCTVHSYRPFGCRIFFCDPTATDWQQEQYEHFHLQLKQIHTDFNVPYMYVEWRQALRALFNR
ncbi:MAG: hypothetical protein KatS3mg104_1958 [Phycisphaerae bacterium]|nr:MAG: hypothetical protein KatS3mg104_1958 [Phycisphaerae bacterium]